MRYFATADDQDTTSKKKAKIETTATGMSEVEEQILGKFLVRNATELNIWRPGHRCQSDTFPSPQPTLLLLFVTFHFPYIDISFLHL